MHEYRRARCTCPGCGEQAQVPFPEAVRAPVQYGTGVVSLCTLLHNDYHLPVAKVSQLFCDLFGYEINGATVLAANARAFTALEPSEQAIVGQVEQARTLHVDETGLRVEGRLHWLHVASTDALSYYFVDARRGRLALESSASVLPSFQGHMIHDCWSSYFRFEQCQHGLCGAHLIRELRAQAELGAAWAGALIDLLLEAHRFKETQGVLPAVLYHELRRRYFSLLREGVATHPLPASSPGRGRKKRGKARSLIYRLHKHHEAVWAFAREEHVPFTNNQAERDLRPAKLKQKVNGGFRTKAGADIFARVRGICSSLRKQGKHVFNELRQVLEQPHYVPFNPAS